MIETNIPGVDGDKIREQVERRAKEYKAGNLRSAPTQPNDTPGPVQQNRYRFADFAHYHDEEFIHQAYQAILRRPPDDNGLRHYLQRLRSGDLSKESILLRLALSPEGRSTGVKISGLWRRTVAEFCYRLPLIGRLVHSLVILLGLPQTLRSLRSELGQLLAANDENTRIVSDFAEDLQTALDRKADATRINDIEIGIAAGDAAREGMQKKLRELRLLVIEQQRRLFLLLAEAKKRLPEPWSNEQLATMAGQDQQLLAAYYVMFEDRFRGTREEIKTRQQIYLPYLGIQDNAPKTVLDLGCGRGEWLELLRENGQQASGVDSNAVMVEQCRELGLSVTEADALTYLTELPSASLAAVTAFHVAEHLPLLQIVALLQEIVRVLLPGGLVIVETPNPENLHVASCNFWCDPTHNRPLPPLLLAHIGEYCGLLRHEIVKLHPFPKEFHVEGTGIAERFNEYFYGPQDYAFIGYKS